MFDKFLDLTTNAIYNFLVSANRGKDVTVINQFFCMEYCAVRYYMFMNHRSRKFSPRFWTTIIIKKTVV